MSRNLVRATAGRRSQGAVAGVACAPRLGDSSGTEPLDNVAAADIIEIVEMSRWQPVPTPMQQGNCCVWHRIGSICDRRRSWRRL